MTRGRLPQRAGLPGLNGGGAADAVPPGTAINHPVPYRVNASFVIFDMRAM